MTKYIMDPNVCSVFGRFARINFNFKIISNALFRSYMKNSSAYINVPWHVLSTVDSNTKIQYHCATCGVHM